MSTYKALASNIKSLRRKKRWSQEELSFQTGIHRTYISSIERGIGNPTLDILIRLGKTLGVKPQDLLGEK